MIEPVNMELEALQLRVEGFSFLEIEEILKARFPEFDKAELAELCIQLDDRESKTRLESYQRNAKGYLIRKGWFFIIAGCVTLGLALFKNVHEVMQVLSVLPMIYGIILYLRARNLKEM